MEIPRDMQEALEYASPQVLPIEGVNGMDIGLDERREGLTIRVLVADPANPPPGIPEELGGHRVRLVAGAPRIHHVIPDQIFHVAATGGIEVGRRTPHFDAAGDFAVDSGALGMIFRDLNVSDPGVGEPLALSCAHVMCGANPTGSFAVGDVIQQPAPTSFAPPAFERLGLLQRWVMPNLPPLPLSNPQVPSGFVDAAVCTVERGFTGSEVEEIGAIAGLAGVEIGEPVKKRGPITGLTFGTVSAFGTYLAYDANDDPLWWMLGQMLIEVDEENTPDGVWSAPGDSGAVVVNWANEVVAMHWGGDGAGIGYATDIFAITTALNLAPG